MQILDSLSTYFTNPVEGSSPEEVYENVVRFLEAEAADAVQDSPEGKELNELLSGVRSCEAEDIYSMLKEILDEDDEDDHSPIIHQGNPDHDPHTQELYSFFQACYDHFNLELFDNSLPNVIFAFTRKKGSMSYFNSKRWATSDKKRVGEIALNPSLFAKSSMLQILSILVREMVSVWRYESFEKAPRKGYHDKKWVGKMLDIGLIPESKESKNGTGQKVFHKISKTGEFIRASVGVPFTHIQYADRFDTETANISIEEEVKNFDYDTSVRQQVLAHDAPNELGSESDAYDNEEKELDDSLGPVEVIAVSSVQDGTIAPCSAVKNGDSPSVDPAEVFAGVEGVSEEQEEKLTAISSLNAVIEDVEPLAVKKKPSNASAKVKYNCAGCNSNVWGKKGLNIDCRDCGVEFSQL